MRAPKIILREVDLRMVEPNVRVIRKSQANAVIECKNELTAGHVVLQPLRWRKQRCRFLSRITS